MAEEITFDAIVRERFEKKFRVNENGCWVWQGAKDKDGYGQFRFNGLTQRAHRFAVELYSGEKIPPGMDVDHTCNNRKCVNYPEGHLETVLHAENMRRMRSKAAPWKRGDNGEEPTSPEMVMLWAREFMEANKLQTPDDVQGGFYRVYTTEGAPWRESDVEHGKIEPGAEWPLLAVYLAVVSQGVNWRAAAKEILNVTPFALKRWKHNPEWKKDFNRARAAGKAQRYEDIEDTALDTMERRLPDSEMKDVVRALEVINKRNDTGNPKKKGLVELPSGGPTFNLLLPGNTSQQREILSAIIEASRPDEVYPALPPPDDDWEDGSFEDDED